MILCFDDFLHSAVTIFFDDTAHCVRIRAGKSLRFPGLLFRKREAKASQNVFGSEDQDNDNEIN
jgi:hypothetical protein